MSPPPPPPPPPPSDDITTTPTSTTFLTIVKLGGRSITDKSTYETLDKTALEKCSILLQNAISKKTKKNENERVIVIHGAGSFGHMSAKRCGLGDEDRKLKMTSSLFLDGCEETRRSVQKLNELVCESLEEERENKVKVECVRRHLGDAWRFNEKGEVDVLGYASVKEYCEAHCFSASPTSSSSSKSLLLLLHGDVVEDATHGRSILSGDRIALEIAKAYALNKTRDQRVVIRVVFITGARGVFSRDPDGVDADADLPCRMLRKIETTIDGEWTCVKDNLKSDIEDIAYATNDSLRYNASSSEHEKNDNNNKRKKEEQISATACSHDVTGGILGKIQSSVTIANLSSSPGYTSVQVYITSVHNENGDEDAFAALSGSVDLETLVDTRTGKPFRGTVIVRKQQEKRD